MHLAFLGLVIHTLTQAVVPPRSTGPGFARVAQRVSQFISMAAAERAAALCAVAAAAWWLLGRAAAARDRSEPPPAIAAAPLAAIPEPPYWAVIFASTMRGGAPDGYDDAADRMAALAAGMPGYLGVESARGADGVGVTVSYWRDEASIAAWRLHHEHAAVQARGRGEWYASFTTRVAQVSRSHSFEFKP